jgi:hypothetical protein
MARKSALEKIEYHEKICRIMQRQTFEQMLSKKVIERISLMKPFYIKVN